MLQTTYVDMIVDEGCYIIRVRALIPSIRNDPIFRDWCMNSPFPVLDIYMHLLKSDG